MGSRTAAATKITNPDELMTVLKRYLRESNESEIVVASRIGVNHHTLHRWLTERQSPTKGRLALTACFPQADRLPVSALRLVEFCQYEPSVTAKRVIWTDLVTPEVPGSAMTLMADAGFVLLMEGKLAKRGESTRFGFVCTRNDGDQRSDKSVAWFIDSSTTGMTALF